MASVYTELKRRRIKKGNGARVVVTVGICTTQEGEGCPKLGDALSGESGTLPPLCVSVEYDESFRPGRVMCSAVWEGLIAHADSYPI